MKDEGSKRLGTIPPFLTPPSRRQKAQNPGALQSVPRYVSPCSPGLKKALQRERLQVLRQNPSYREMERLRQRSMMQLKRQDPSFRALERERQRARMQLRRQDPSFR